MTNDRRICITGYGSVSAVTQHSQVDFYETLLAEPAPERQINPQVNRISEMRAEQYIDESKLRRMDRLCQMAMIASEKSFKSARLTINAENASRSGVIFNNCFGPLESTETYVSKLIREGGKRAPAGLFPYTVVSVFTGLVTMGARALGTNSTISGANPICYGIDAIRQGTDDCMLVGGCDEITPSLASWFRETGYFTEPKLAESDDEEHSFSLGEASAALILERKQMAEARGAHPLAEILDYGNMQMLRSPNPYYLSAPCVESAMRKALTNSGIEPRQVSLFVAASNGLPALSDAEDEAFSRVFDTSIQPVYLNVKRATGETLGASGLFGLIAAAEVLSRGQVPKSLTRKAKTLASRPTHSAPFEYALVNSYEFGGNVNSLVVKRYESTLQ